MASKKIFINKLPLFFSFVAGALLLILLSILLIIDNVNIYNKRVQGNVRTIENYTLEKVEKEDTPLDLIVVYTFTLPNEIKEGESISFYTLHQYTDVYIEDELIYSVTKSNDNTMTQTYGSDWIMIPLSINDKGKEITIVITPVYKFVVDSKIEIMIGSSIVMFEASFKKDLIQLVLGTTVVFIGFIFILISLINRRKNIDVNKLLSLGIFACLLGVWRITNVKFTPYLDFGKPTFIIYVSLASFMMFLPPLIFSIRERYKNKSRRLLDISSICISSLVIIEVILQLLGVIDVRQILDILNIIVVIVAVIAIGGSIYEQIKYRKKGETPPYKSLIIIAIGGLLDIFFFYVNHSSRGLIGTLVSAIFYVVIEGVHILVEYSENERRINEQERELIEKELAIKMSQIQPHFLYNSLTSIYYLSDKDPKLTKKAIKWFSTYLRGNLESMSRNIMVTFEQELNHIDIYLKLEKLRFGEYLEVIYNIEEKDFLIPTFAIQPIVENAVKYGVGDKKEGGQVIISSTSTDTHYIVTVEDTGTGFDVNKEYEPNRKHIGIQNVKERLSMICNGELVIHSEIDKGTIAIIRIPKDYGGGLKIYEYISGR